MSACVHTCKQSSQLHKPVSFTHTHVYTGTHTHTHPESHFSSHFWYPQAKTLVCSGPKTGVLQVPRGGPSVTHGVSINMEQTYSSSRRGRAHLRSPDSRFQWRHSLSQRRELKKHSEIFLLRFGTLGGQSGRIAWAQELETSLGNIVGPHIYKKSKN